MSKESWFSARLRFAIMIGSMGADTINDRIFLLKSKNFDAAFSKALDIGRREEKTYKNEIGEDVMWRFSEILSLDIIVSADLDGAEVYSEPIHLSDDEIIPDGVDFEPEKSKPIQTL
jgi:hypothetical protein